MKRRDSLRIRIIASFTITGAILGFVFGLLVYAVLHDLEDQLTVNRLNIEADAFRQRWVKDPQARPLSSALLQGYLGETQLPTQFSGYTQREGIFEVSDEYMILVDQLPDGQWLYMIEDNRGVDPLETAGLGRVITGCVFLVTLLSGWLGHILANRMMAPLLGLAAEVRDLDPNHLPRRLEGKYYQDEVGLVASALGTSLGRVAELLERERRFTRDASHELRTPVTVIKGATELVNRLHDAGKPVTKPLRRIERGVKDMENIIGTFLYLGREGHAQEEASQFNLMILVQEQVEQNRYIVEEKDVDVKISGDEDVKLNTSRTVAGIAIGNLVRNAMLYTEEGHVEVIVTAHRVQVCDTGRGMDEATQEKVLGRDQRAGSGKGFGLGLSIVSDFCKRYGWQFRLESIPGEGTQTTIVFEQEPNQTTGDVS